MDTNLPREVAVTERTARYQSLLPSRSVEIVEVAIVLTVAAYFTIGVLGIFFF